MTVSAQLEKAIASSDMTYYRIAKDAGIDWKTIAAFMDGTRPNVSIDSVDRIAAVLGLELVVKKRTSAPKNKARTKKKTPAARGKVKGRRKK
ncbi:MAG: helix-turn-helix transcriptional regulator [Planctomycetes bacterium]|nr:helix-turn-helix transcriptional regulator [Planctomycetota bacterium]